jgi:hypothetical protein
MNHCLAKRYVLDSAFFTSQRETILKFAAQARIPVAYGNRRMAEQGALFSYSADFSDMFRRAAGYVDKQDSEGRKARRTPDRAAHQVRAGGQSQDGESAGDHDPGIDIAAGGRGHSVGIIGILAVRDQPWGGEVTP